MGLVSPLGNRFSLGYGFGYDEAKGKLAFPLMAASQPKDDEYFTEVESIWDLPRLYADLTAIGWVLTPTQKRYLRGLLAGLTVKEMGEKLCVSEGTVKVALSKNIYPAIRDLTGNSLVDSRSLPSLLDECGYKYSTSKDLTSPVGSPVGDTSAITSCQEIILTEDESKDEIPSWLIPYADSDAKWNPFAPSKGSKDFVALAANKLVWDVNDPLITVKGRSKEEFYRLVEAFQKAINRLIQRRYFHAVFVIDMKDVNIPPPPNVQVRVSDDFIDLNEIQLFPERTKAILTEYLVSKVIPARYKNPEHWQPESQMPASQEAWLNMLVRQFPFIFLFKNHQVISKGELTTIKSFLTSTLKLSKSRAVFIEE